MLEPARILVAIGADAMTLAHCKRVNNTHSVAVPGKPGHSSLSSRQTPGSPRQARNTILIMRHNVNAPAIQKGRICVVNIDSLC
jgi:hypothetical protein